jgi:uncharacterized protein (TIGR03435 family)
MLRALPSLILASFAFAQPAPHPPVFEVASIRPNPGPWRVLGGYSASGPRLTLEGYEVRNLIMEAFNLKRHEVAYPPVAMEVYDIAAKAAGEGSLTRAEFRLMLQALLSDRFKFKYHREKRKILVYALVVGKNGPKFKEAAPDAPRVARGGVNGSNQSLTLSHGAMSTLADEIGNNFGPDRPVLDRTGLTGEYDIKLEATPEFRFNGHPPPDSISVFDAVRDQLGLRLESQSVSIEVLVVDHIENPSRN